MGPGRGQQPIEHSLVLCPANAEFQTQLENKAIIRAVHRDNSFQVARERS